MVSNLEFLRGELTKVEKELNNTNPRNYKKYFALYQTYIGLTYNINELEKMKKHYTSPVSTNKDTQQITNLAENQSEFRG